MSALHEIAFYRKRRDEVPNQELAHRLARSRDLEGIAEIAGGLRDKKQSIQSDCLKALYEIGYLEPELIADHVGEFLELLRSKNNRMVWGALIALAAIDARRPELSPSQRAKTDRLMRKAGLTA